MSDSPSFEIIDSSSSQDHQQDSSSHAESPSPVIEAEAEANSPTLLSQEQIAEDETESASNTSSSSEEEEEQQEEKEESPIEPAVIGEFAKPHFGIVVVGRNASSSLKRLMDSLSDYTQGGGQVIFYDTGSKDNTVELAGQLGMTAISGEKIPTAKLQKASAKYIKETFIADNANIFRMGDYCLERSTINNTAAQTSPFDLVLFLSPTDEVKTINVDYINGLAASGANNFFFNVTNRTPDSNVESFANLNNFYNRTLQRWEGCGVEELYSCNAGAASKIQPISLPTSVLNVIHWRDSPEEEQNATDMLIGAAIDAANHRKNSQMVHHLGMRLCYGGYTASAIKTLTKHLQMDTVLESRRSLSACAIAQLWMGRAVDEQQRVRGIVEEAKRKNVQLSDREVMDLTKKVTSFYDSAKEFYVKAFYHDCGWRTPILGLADIALRLNDWERAVIWAKAAEQIKKTSVVTENVGFYVYGVEEILLKAYFNIWKQSKNASRTVQSAFFQLAKDAYDHCKEVAEWLPFVSTYAEIFKHDQDYAFQHVADVK